MASKPLAGVAGGSDVEVWPAVSQAFPATLRRGYGCMEAWVASEWNLRMRGLTVIGMEQRPEAGVSPVHGTWEEQSGEPAT